MQLHRPKSLDDLNIDFFSGETLPEEEISPVTETEAPKEAMPDEEIDLSMYTEVVPNKTESAQIESERKIPQLPHKDPSEPYSHEEILDFLSEDFSKLDDVLGDITFTKTEENEPSEDEKMDKKEPLVDEKTALESFPDLSDSIIDLAAKPTPSKDDRQSEKDAIKKAKEDAKNTIENEKKRIKEQKKLEKTVQMPFGKRRAAIILLVVFLIIGILASACAALIYAVDKSDEGYIKISGITVGYVDGEKIKSDKNVGEYIFVKQGRVQGNDTLLFVDADRTLAVADVIGFGDGVYAVSMRSTVYRVSQANILGSAKFKTPNIAVVRNIVADYSVVAFAALGIYLVLVILFSAIRIRKLNSVIRELEENYELV